VTTGGVLSDAVHDCLLKGLDDIDVVLDCQLCADPNGALISAGEVQEMLLLLIATFIVETLCARTGICTR
jgi:hypothetical protein